MFTFEKWSHWQSLGYLDLKLLLDTVLGGTSAARKYLRAGRASLEGVHYSYQEVSTKHVTVLKNQHGHLGNSLRVYKTIDHKLGCFLRALSAAAPFFNFDI